MSRILSPTTWRRHRAAFTALVAFAGPALPSPLRALARPNGFVSPTVTLTPGTTTFTGTGSTYTVAVTVKLCSTNSADINDAATSFTLDGSAVSLTNTHTAVPGCIFSRTYTGNVVLPQTNEGVHEFWAQTEDMNGWAAFKKATYTYHWPGWQPPKYAVRVTAAAHTIDVAPGSGRTASFTLTNFGSRTTQYALTYHCTGGATCTGTSTSPVTLDTITKTATATLTFTAGPLNDTGSVMLVAHNTGSGLSADADSASTDVMIPAPIANNSPGVVIAGSGDVLARDACLTVAAGKDGAYECGDLRLAHALPTVVTRGKARTPVLLYNSAQAVGNVVVAADVTPVTTMGALDSVVAKVLVGGVQWGRGKWVGSQWPGDSTRRIGITIDSLKATGVYSFTLNVQYFWAGGTTTTDAPTGQLVVVNRNASSFGAGWWLAGVEQLMPSGSDLLWIGGDGSAHLYRASGTNLWRATTGVRPDSVYWTGSVYERTLPSGTRIEFNGTGQHTATRPLVGPATYFAYAGTGLTSALTRITIPSGHADGDTTVRYNFTYFTDSVVAVLTAGGTTRRTTALRSGANVTSIRDPDGTSVQFAYMTGLPYVNRRTDRNSHATMYTYDAAWHLVRDSLPLAGVGTIVETFAPTESRGVAGTATAAAQSPDSTYTLVDGPRTDVADVMRVWLNKYGGPARIKNAYGRETKLYFDATWPALPDSVRSPSGALTRAWYNSRGLTDSTKVYNLRFTGDVGAATRYTWHATLAVPTQITGADGSVKSFGYNADGTLQWAQTGTSTSTRDSIWYNSTGAAVGLYAMSNVPGRSERDSVEYDASLANPSQVKDRTGHWSYTTRDGLGRPTLSRTEFASGKWRRDSTIYNLSDEVSNTISWGDSATYTEIGGAGSGFGRSTVPAETLYVRNTYDAEGQVLAVARWSHPNPIGLDTAIDNFLYDEAGRKTSEWTQTGVDNTYTYDLAGNLIEQRGTLTDVQMAYDAMGKPTQRIVERTHYSPTSCTTFVPYAMGSDCKFSFPIQTNGGLLTLPGDTVTFAYDAFGNLLRADNKSARIRRSYTPGGLLVTDSSFVRTLRYATEGSSVPANDFTSHKYGIRYGYDGAGRLDSLWHPDVLDPCSGPCPAQRYAYDTTTGRLSSLVDVRGKTFTFRYTDAGQLRALVYPGNTLDTTTYDAEGRVFKRRVMDAGGFAFIADSLQYDPMGRVITGTGRVLHTGDPQTLLNVYGGLGPLVATEHYINGATPTTYEEFQYDALANQFWSRRSGIHLGGSADEPSIRDHHYDAEGRVTDVQPEDTLLLDDYDWHHYWYDAEGRTTFTTDRVDVGAATPNQEAHYYDGEGRLVLLERHHGWSVDTLYSDANEPEALSEWYRYDALGRRVLVFTHHEKMRSCTAEGCESTLSRYVWAGDQLLYETRAAAADSITSSNVETDTPGGDGEYGSPKAYGTVGYTHAGGIDRPLGVMRMDNGSLTTAFYPQLNWRGLYETATTDTGTQFASRDFIKWPGAVASAYLGANTKPDSAFWWYGSQITESADASGLMYRRNRYYDPASGRFTQPDPIGIEGGINEYAFAGGNPLSYVDPFGTDTTKKDDQVGASKPKAKCNESTGADCEPGVKKLIEADKPIEPQITTKGIVEASAVIATGGTSAEAEGTVEGAQAAGKPVTKLVVRASSALARSRVASFSAYFALGVGNAMLGPFDSLAPAFPNAAAEAGYNWGVAVGYVVNHLMK